MKIVLTLHAQEKLQEKDAKSLKITRKQIFEILTNPDKVNKTKNPHQSIGRLNDSLTLCVIWKIENEAVKVVTFYPAEKGRYESKVF